MSEKHFEEMKEIVKGEHNKLNQIAHKRSGVFMMKGKELLKEDPRIVRIDGIVAKEMDSNTIFGKKIK